MKPYPKWSDYEPTTPGRDPMIPIWVERYHRARADWYESEVVPLLKEAREYATHHLMCAARYSDSHDSVWRECDCGRDAVVARIDAVLRELEGKT